nr:disease resistance protein rpm1 [Quercus suber]
MTSFIAMVVIVVGIVAGVGGRSRGWDGGDWMFEAVGVCGGGFLLFGCFGLVPGLCVVSNKSEHGPLFLFLHLYSPSSNLYDWKEGEPNNSAIELGASLKAKMDSAIVQHLIDNILSAVATEASLLTGVRDAIEDVQHELTRMRSFLMDAVKRGASSAGEETSLTQVKNTAYDVEDVIDMFMYHINSHQIGGGFAWFLHRTIYIPQTLCVRHKIASKLQKINNTIKTISELNQKYHGEHIERSSSEDSHKWVLRHSESCLFVEEDELLSKYTILLKKIFKFNFQVPPSIFKLNIRWCKSWVLISRSGLKTGGLLGPASNKSKHGVLFLFGCNIIGRKGA